MKKFIILSILLSTFSFSFSQGLRANITYEATLDNTDFHNRLMKDSTVTEYSRNSQLENIRSTSPMNFVLYINGNEALYHAEFDLETQRSLGLGYNRTGEIAQDENTYYTNLQTKEYYFQNYFTKEVLVNTEKVDWRLTKETKKIGEYTCYKATAIIDSEQLYGMNFMSPVIAWYTPEIPTSFGIQIFNGLPGLTLELITDYQKGKVHYKAIEIDLTPEEYIIEKPTGKRQISEKEYIAYIKKLNKNRF